MYRPKYARSGMSYRVPQDPTAGDFRLPELHAVTVSTGLLGQAFEVSLCLRDHLGFACSLRLTRAIHVRRWPVLLGHMVRMFKLYDTSLLLFSRNRVEMAMVLYRAIFETGVNLRFFLKNDDLAEIERYQKASVANCDKLSGYVQQAGSPDRALLPTEKNLKAVRNQDAGSLAYDVEAVTKGSWNAPGAFQERAKFVGAFPVEYGAGFVIPSWVLRGSWSDLEHHHLMRSSDEYAPRLEYQPQDSNRLPPGAFCARVGFEYLAKVRSKREGFARRLARFVEWYAESCQLSERLEPVS